MKSQKGATLIVILVLLVLITIIGTVAIRQSTTALNIATNSQAQQILFENSNSATLRVQNINNILANTSRTGMLGYMQTDENINKELVFCYGGSKTNFFRLSQASIMSWPDGTTKPANTDLGNSGFCKVEDSASYTSARQVVMTQISFRVGQLQTATTSNLENYVDGSDQQILKKIEQGYPVTVTAVSLIPSLSTASAEQINSCLSTHMNDPQIPSNLSTTDQSTATQNAQTITECLKALNVPVNTQVSTYLYQSN